MKAIHKSNFITEIRWPITCIYCFYHEYFMNNMRNVTIETSIKMYVEKFHISQLDMESNDFLQRVL